MSANGRYCKQVKNLNLSLIMTSYANEKSHCAFTATSFFSIVYNSRMQLLNNRNCWAPGQSWGTNFSTFPILNYPAQWIASMQAPDAKARVTVVEQCEKCVTTSIFQRLPRISPPSRYLAAIWTWFRMVQLIHGLLSTHRLSHHHTKRYEKLWLVCTNWLSMHGTP